MAKPYATELKTLQSAAAATGNGEPLRLNGLGSVGFQVAGTFVGEITFEARQTTWVPIQCFNLSTGAVSTLATAPGMYVGFAANAVEVQARISDYDSGAITVTAMASQGAGLSLADIDVETGEIIGVTGTFWQTTQPVSIAAMPTTPVTGAFYPDTQPVSLATAPSTPVTGTFYPETQPVSIATAPALVASEAHVGEVGGNSVLKDVTLSLDTNIYAIGDVLAATQEITTAMRANGGMGLLTSVEVTDVDDQGQPFDLVFFKEAASLGTENAAVSITDADAVKKLGTVEVAAYDYVDFVNSQSATKRNIGLVVGSAADSTSIFVGAISRGTGTYTAGGITLRLGFLRD